MVSSRHWKKAHSDLLILVICHFHKNVFFLKLQNALSLNVQFVFTHECFHNTQAFRICKQKNETGSSTMFSFSLSNRLYLKYPPSQNILLEGLSKLLIGMSICQTTVKHEIGTLVQSYLNIDHNPMKTGKGIMQAFEKNTPKKPRKKTHLNWECQFFRMSVKDSSPWPTSCLLLVRTPVSCLWQADPLSLPRKSIWWQSRE